MTNYEDLRARPKDDIINDIYDFILIQCPPTTPTLCHGLQDQACMLQSKTHCRQCWQEWFDAEVQP